MEQVIEYGDSVRIVMRRTSINGGLLRKALLDKLGFVPETDEAYPAMDLQARTINGLKLWFAKSMSQIVEAKGLSFEIPRHANGNTESLFDQFCDLDEVLVWEMWNTAQALDAPIGEKKTGNNSGDADSLSGAGKRRGKTAKTG